MYMTSVKTRGERKSPEYQIHEGNNDQVPKQNREQPKGLEVDWKPSYQENQILYQCIRLKFNT